MRNPFADDIFAPGEPGVGPAAGVFQAEALAMLERTVGETGGAVGRALVVTAPRAGYGKTHVVARFAERLAGRAFVVPLTFDLETPPRWTWVLGAMLEKLHRDHGHRAGLSLLDEAARFLFARVNQRLIESGKIPCSHPAEAVAALDRNYLEMFDFADPGQEVARWFSDHFEGLVPLTSAGLAPEAMVDPESVGHWLRVLVAYAQGVDQLPSHRLEALKWAVNASAASAMGGGGGPLLIQDSAGPELAAKEKLRDLGRLLCLYRPMVFVVDHLDAFHRDGAAGLRIAYFVSELRRLLPRSLSVVCVNQDLWQSTFHGQLPSALEDRMAGGFVGLRGLNLEQATQLVRDRLKAAGAQADGNDDFWSRLRLPEFLAALGGQAVSPRVVLRHAAGCWARSGWSPPVPAPAMKVPAPPPMVLVPGTAGGSADPLFATGGGGATPASSVVGEETLDSISEALRAMVEATGGVPDPTDASSGVNQGSFQRLRERLDRLRPVAQGEEGSVPGTANGHPPAAGGALAEAFSERLQRRTEAPVPPTLDLERLGRLLRFAGDHFPVVRTAELAVPGTSGTALQWLSPDAEILIGLEPATRPIFWSALTAHAAARLKLNGGLPVKIVAFVEPGLSVHPAVAGRQTGGYTIDLVAPSAAELHQLAAACDVLDSAVAGNEQAGTQDFAPLLAQVLEPFWRRLTRLAAAPSA